MSNGSYFSQYESPNIVIVPTISCNPPSPKRRKIGNNIIVPIVNSVICEKQKLKCTQETKIPEDSNVDKKKEKSESSSKSPSLNISWASNYLQSIGLEKISSIRNRKIPRMSASQSSVVSVKPSKTATVENARILACGPKTDIYKNKFKIPKNIATCSKLLQDSTTQIKPVVEIKSRSIKDKSKQTKQSKNESTKSVSIKTPSSVKNNETHEVPICNNKNISHGSNKIKTGNINNNKTHEQQTNCCTSDKHSSCTKSESVVKMTSPKDNLSTKESSIKCRKKTNNKVEKSNIKSVLIKQNQSQHNTKCNDTTRSNQSKNNSVKVPSSYATDNYKDEGKKSKCSVENVSCKKNIKVIKKHDISDLEKSNVLKKEHHKPELKTRVVRNQEHIRSKTKPKEKMPNIKSDLKSIKKTIKSPIKKNNSKTKNYRKIKLVINLICNNKLNPSQCTENYKNENNGGSTKCTVSNVDLDFLNDFDIDGIVESLDTCEKNSSQYVECELELDKCQNNKNINKHCVTSNINPSYNNNTDITDLIKTLKGEEDDDLTRISNEHAKELLISKDNNKDSCPNIHKLDNVLKIENPKISNDHPEMIVQKEEKGKLETLSKPSNTVSSNIVNDLKNVMITEHVAPNRDFKYCNTNKDESGKASERTTLKRKAEEIKCNNIPSPPESVVKTTLETLSMDLENKKCKSIIKVKEEQDIDPFISNINSLPMLDNIKLDSYQGVNQENCNCLIIDNNNLTNSGNNPVHQKSSENLSLINKNTSLPIQEPQKVASTTNVEKIIDQRELNSDSLDTSNNRSKQNNDAAYVAHQLKPKKLNNEHQTYAGEDKENKSSFNKENSIKLIEDGKNYDKQDNNKTTNSMKKKDILLQNNSDVKLKNKNNIASNNNVLNVESKNPGGKVQDIFESDKKEQNVHKDSSENKQKDLPHNDSESMANQVKLLESNENSRGNIKSKADLEIILKLEERLVASSGSKYSITSIIHTGKYSKIFRCKHPNGKYYALKMPTININYDLGREKKQMLNSFITDIPKNNLFLVCLVKAFNMGESWCFLMEHYPKNLEQALSETNKPFSIEHIQDYARQLIMAVMVLKNKNMVHLDIKPKHILINSSNNMIKVCGFDRLSYVNKMKVLPNVGTVNYRAPEVILGYKCGFEIDVWSTGLVLYEMAANKKLFPGTYNNDILYKQICTLGCVPYDMIKKSRFSGIHFVGSKFMRKSGFKGQYVNIVPKFYKNNKLCDSIYNAYFANWGHHRSISQQNCDIGKLSILVKLLEKMLTMHPESRLPIEFAYANPFIYDGYSYQEW